MVNDDEIEQRIGAVFWGAVERGVLYKRAVMADRDRIAAELKTAQGRVADLENQLRAAVEGVEKMASKPEAHELVAHALRCPRDLWLAALRANPSTRSELIKLIEDTAPPPPKLEEVGKAGKKP